MNRNEWLNYKHKNNVYYKQIQKLLRDWKIENNITETCVVHHRDDTEECKKYNEEHYELWGFEIDENSDMHFETGKYVVFMTSAEHTRYHNSGEKHPFYGKHLSDETKAKLSEVNKGKHLSTEAKAKISEANKGEKNPFYGKHLSTEAKAKISEANKGKHLSDETKAKLSEVNKSKQLASDHKNKISDSMKVIGDLWRIYIQIGGTASYNEFRKSIKSHISTEK